jgi:chemotaxis signal transduction protein
VNSIKNKPFSGLFIFRIQDQEFCLDLKEIINVIKLNESVISQNGPVTELEYAGEKYKIISFDKIYKLNYKTSAKTRVILVKIKKKLLGFHADEIVEIMAINENSPAISRSNHNKDPFIKLIIKYGEREMIVPQMEKVLSSAEQ